MRKYNFENSSLKISLSLVILTLITTYFLKKVMLFSSSSGNPLRFNEDVIILNRI